MNTIRRTVTDQPGLLVSTDDGSFSRLQFHREIRDELIPPSGENDRYRGRITLVTRYSYSYRPPREEETTDEAQEKKTSSSIDDPFQIGQLPSDPLKELESDLTESLERPGLDQLVPRNLGKETEDVEENTYELEYIDGRWLVTTRFDPKDDKFMQETFEFALKRQ